MYIYIYIHFLIFPSLLKKKENKIPFLKKGEQKTTFLKKRGTKNYFFKKGMDWGKQLCFLFPFFLKREKGLCIHKRRWLTNC